MASLNSRFDSHEDALRESASGSKGKTLSLAGAALAVTLATLAGAKQAQAQEEPPSGPAWDCEWLDDSDGPGRGKAPNAVKTGTPHADVGPAAVVVEESDAGHTTVRVEHGTTLAVRVRCKKYPNQDQLEGLLNRIRVNGKPIPAEDKEKIRITTEEESPVIIYIPFLAVDEEWSDYETDFNTKEDNAKRLMSEYGKALREGKPLDVTRLKSEIKSALEELRRAFNQMKTYAQGAEKHPNKTSRIFEFPKNDGNFIKTMIITQTVPTEEQLRRFFNRAKRLFNAFKSNGGPERPAIEEAPTRGEVDTVLARRGRIKGVFTLGGIQDGVTSDEKKLYSAEGGVEAYLSTIHWKNGSVGLTALLAAGGQATRAPGTHSPGPYIGLQGGIRVEQKIGGAVYIYVTLYAGANISVENEEYEGMDDQGRKVILKVNSEVRPVVGGKGGIGVKIADLGKSGSLSFEVGYRLQGERRTAEPNEGMRADHKIEGGFTWGF